MTGLYDAQLYSTQRRSVIFVDAGYLLHVMQEYHQVSTRGHLEIDHPKLVELLRHRAEQMLGCPVLRIYWYDAVHPSGKVPNLVVSEMRRIDGVRVRTGTLQFKPGGGQVQKAVDTLLVRDMIVHAFKKTADEMVLVSGDIDLVPGVEEAQEQGVRVHLWSVSGEELAPSVGRDLENLVDSRGELEATTLAESIHGPPALSPARPVDADGSQEATPASVPTDATEPEPPVESHPAPASPLAMPAHAERPRRLEAMRETPSVYAGGEASFPRLFDISRDAYNEPLDEADAKAAGRAYALRWAAAVDRADLDRMLRHHRDGFTGNIPKSVDGDLLYFGSDHGLDTYAHPLKLALRHGFWRGITEAASGP